MENLDSVMRRISKLLAIAGDDRANPNEAAAAAAMAEKVMRAYQISNASVIAAAMRKNNDEFGSDFVYGSTKPSVPSKTIQVWANWLSVAIAKFNDCNIYMHQKQDKTKVLIFKGYKPDIEMCKYMFHYIVGIMEQSASNLDFGDVHGREFMSSYRQGFILAVSKKLKEMTAQKQAEMQTESSGRELVIAKRDAVARQFGVQKFGRGSVTSHHADAYMKGRENGSKVDISRRGVGTSAGSSLRLN